jgi:ABC-type phosphate transport system auxiliary subunit
MVLSLTKTINKMSRLKQNQIIDNAIQSIASITKSQCSLSEQDLTVLNEALERLQFLRRKKGKTNQQIQKEIAKSVELLVKFFTQD